MTAESKSTGVSCMSTRYVFITACTVLCLFGIFTFVFYLYNQNQLSQLAHERIQKLNQKVNNIEDEVDYQYHDLAAIKAKLMAMDQGRKFSADPDGNIRRTNPSGGSMEKGGFVPLSPPGPVGLGGIGQLGVAPVPVFSGVVPSGNQMFPKLNPDARLEPVVEDGNTVEDDYVLDVSIGLEATGTADEMKDLELLLNFWMAILDSLLAGIAEEPDLGEE